MGMPWGWLLLSLPLVDAWVDSSSGSFSFRFQDLGLGH